MRLRVPSKTFFVGEYVALKGGPALVVCTEPDFIFEKHNEVSLEQTLSLYEGSPSFLYSKKENLESDLKQTSMHDPHDRRGGFGASGAKFIFLNVLANSKKWQDPFFLRKKLLEHTNSSRPPSGYDVMSQVTGRVAKLVVNKNQAQSLSWNYPGVDFAVVRTGYKMQTHDYLETLPDLNLEKLEVLANEAIMSYESGHLSFFTKVSEYYNELVQLKLIDKKSQAMVSQAVSSKLFLSGKACGAGGVDTMLFFFESEIKKEVQAYFQKHELEIVHFGHHLASAAQVYNESPEDIKR